MSQSVLTPMWHSRFVIRRNITRQLWNGQAKTHSSSIQRKKSMVSPQVSSASFTTIATTVATAVGRSLS